MPQSPHPWGKLVTHWVPSFCFLLADEAGGLGLRRGSGRASCLPEGSQLVYSTTASEVLSLTRPGSWSQTQTKSWFCSLGSGEVVELGTGPESSESQKGFGGLKAWGRTVPGARETEAYPATQPASRRPGAGVSLLPLVSPRALFMALTA